MSFFSRRRAKAPPPLAGSGASEVMSMKNRLISQASALGQRLDPRERVKRHPFQAIAVAGLGGVVLAKLPFRGLGMTLSMLHPLTRTTIPLISSIVSGVAAARASQKAGHASQAANEATDHADQARGRAAPRQYARN